MNRLIIYWVLLCLVAGGGAYGQSSDITIQGKVTGTEENGLLTGVSVTVKNLQKGTATGANGTYTLSVPRKAVLVFSYQGYETQEIAVDGKTTIDVELKSSNKLLNDVVVGNAVGGCLSELLRPHPDYFHEGPHRG